MGENEPDDEWIAEEAREKGISERAVRISFRAIELAYADGVIRAGQRPGDEDFPHIDWAPYFRRATAQIDAGIANPMNQ
jgi:hypothetical protein